MDEKRLKVMFNKSWEITKSQLEGHNDCDIAKVAASLVQSWATIEAAETMATEIKRVSNEIDYLRKTLGQCL